jgi:DNA-binding IclR family transcriptional regulator
MTDGTAIETDERPRTDGDVSAGHIAAVLRGLAVLDMFSREVSVVGIADIARTLGVHKSSASRVASTLAAAGYLRATGVQGHYRLGPRLISLGALADSGSGLEDLVMPHLRALSEATGETGHLAVLDGSQAVTIGVADGWHTVRMHSWVGKSSPAYLSSMGKALLAGRSEAVVRGLYPGPLEPATNRSITSVDRLLDAIESIRARGYATDDEELEIGLRCVAAPIFDRDGLVVGALSVSGPSQRFSDAAIRPLADFVRWAAAQASQALGARSSAAGWPPFPGDPPESLDWVDRVRQQRLSGSIESR